MNSKEIAKNVLMLASIDWGRRLFDSLIPLPDGTTYNAYLVKGSEKTALIDTTDTEFSNHLLDQLKDVKKIDYIISNHSEQDHSGTIPLVLEKYPEAKLICTQMGKILLMDHLHIAEDKFQIVKNKETLSLGDKTLEFLHMPWVHWPETMVTYLKEDKILFSCDLFGSHIAASDTYAVDEVLVYEAAKRYYAEIMMPFRKQIQTYLDKLNEYEIKQIAPSHGPAYDKPKFILDAYTDWVNDKPKNSVVIPYISMHGSTKKLIDKLVEGLMNEGIEVHQFDIVKTDIGKLAVALVDVATIVVGVPTLRDAPHPNIAYVLNVANAIVPKAKYVAVLNSYGWNNKSTLEAVTKAIPNLNVEVIGVLASKGRPREKQYEEVNELVKTIVEKHKRLGFNI